METDILLLVLSAASIGFIHTLTGPDHYLPFIFISKARKWSLKKTILITTLCGLGHVGSSIILGIIGIIFGITIAKIEIFDGIRGSIAAWLFIIFGFSYFIWGIWKIIKNKPHTHLHYHNGITHEHEHTHNDEHVHLHEDVERKNITPWILFLIFVFGPCEPLIPLLMYPAAKSSIGGVIAVSVVFSIVTILTMVILVVLPLLGINFLNLRKLDKYTHMLAGLTIFLCGISIEFLGL